ncbi:hypothetical protein DdX_20203 [Ditylenchus destructor]|uniref:Uncharacterized protein n=1 Tax=Ditylenchus destructor TaxID=166010 RepID=A0AAD4QWQ9_9BILA|nr:hypothetical protein DdX_20203 [Ditylenchus destructor]
MGGAGLKIHLRLVDEVGARVPQVRHREERETRDPGGVALPVRPVQVVRQLFGRQRVLLHVVEAAAVQGPLARRPRPCRAIPGPAASRGCCPASRSRRRRRSRRWGFMTWTQRSSRLAQSR